MPIRFRRLPTVSTRWLQLLLLCTLLAGHGLLQAQDSASANTAATPARLQQDISQLRQAAAELPEAELKPVSTLLDDAEQRLGSTARLQQERQQLEQANQQTPAAPAPVTAEQISQALQQWVGKLPEQASNTQLERLLADERSAQETLQQQIQGTTRALTDLILQPAQVMDELNTLRQQVHQPPAAGSNPEADLASQARQLQEAASYQEARAQLALRELELASTESRQRQLESRQAELQQQLALRAPRLGWLEQRIALNSQQRLQQLAEQMQQLASGSNSSNDPAIAALAQQNLDLANQLQAESQAVLQDQALLTRQEAQRDRIVESLRETQARLELGSSSVSMGQWLWKQRQGMPSSYALLIQRRKLEQQIGELRLQLYNLNEQQRRLQGSTASAASQTSDQAQTLNRWQLTQADLVEQLIPVLRRRIVLLEHSHAALFTIDERGSELRKLMDQQLLWVPSHAAIGSDWLRALPASMRASLEPEVTPHMARLLWQDLRERPFSYLLGLALIVGMFAVGSHARRDLQRLGQLTRNPLQDNFVHTLLALLWTLVLSLPWAALAWGNGYILQRLGAGVSPLVTAWGQALVQLSGLVMVLAFVHALLRQDGLAQSHLYWRSERVDSLRKVLPVATLTTLPAALLALVPLYAGSDLAVSGQARLGLMLLALAMAALSLWLGRLATHERQPGPAGQGPTAMQRMTRLLRWLLPLAFLFCLVIAAMGYVLSGAIVLQALMSSMVVFVGVGVLSGLFKRWLLLSERRIALRQMERGDDPAESTVVDLEADDAPRQTAPELTLVNISAQSRRLVRTLLITLLLLGLLWAWAEVLPALAKLDDVVLWHASDTGAAGEKTDIPVSLGDVLGSAVLLAIMISLARNLPGLVEILLSARNLVSASARYTITTLLRYAITIAGVVLALQTLGLRWSQLQWMAAALSVGLGFGLQEIFANFVSGLILLVERPFRVGDTITIGNLTGTVSRIHTRATTVLDYDQKEVLIPNKTFITSEVVNWTLNNTVTRLILRVDVGYDSDPAQVHALLRQVARDDPRVMTEPAPSSVFMGMGASALNFELRLFVDMNDRMGVMTDLNARILATLKHHQIEIPFPQMDVHVRDVPAGDTVTGKPDGAAAAGKAV